MLEKIKKVISKFMKLFAQGMIIGGEITALGGGVYIRSIIS